MSNQAVCN